MWCIDITADIDFVANWHSLTGDRGKAAQRRDFVRTQIGHFWTKPPTCSLPPRRDRRLSSSKVLSKPKCDQLQLCSEEHKIGGWSRIHKFHQNPNWPNQPAYLFPAKIPPIWDVEEGSCRADHTDCSAEQRLGGRGGGVERELKRKSGQNFPTNLHTAPLMHQSAKISPISRF